MTANLTTRLGQLTSSPAGGPYTGANKIINGDMAIDQRNAGASITPTASVYCLDRWKAANSVTSKYSVQQNAGSVAVLAGMPSTYVGITSLSAYSSLAANDFFSLWQAIEGLNCTDLLWGTSAAQPITISFWVRSSLTGTFGGCVGNNSANRSYPFTYTISAANTWEQKSVTIPGDTTGTWLTTNGSGMYVYLGIGVGTTYSGTANAWAAANYQSATGATNVLGTNGATIYWTAVKLEKGSIATPFVPDDYQVSLVKCYRYFQSYSYASNTAVAMATAYGTTATYGTSTIQAPMRAAPTGSYTGSLLYFSNVVSYACSSISFSNTTGNTWEISTAVAGAVGGSGGWFRTNGASTLTLNAEL